MKKLFLPIVFVASFLSTVAWAQIESHVLGTWQGELAYTDAEGTEAACTARNLFAVEENKLILHQVLGGDCDWESHIEFALQDREVWQDGVKIGEFIGDNSLEIKDFNLNGEGLFTLKITVDNEEGTHALYSDRTDYGEGFWDSLSGEMVKAETAPEPLL